MAKLLSVEGLRPSVLRTASVQIIPSATWVDIKDLTFPVVMGRTYAFHFHIVFRSVNTTTGYAFGVNGPSGSTVQYIIHVQTMTDGNTAGPPDIRHRIVFDTTTPSSSTAQANLDCFCMIEGTLVVGSTDGVFAARAASELTNSDLTIRPGSWGYWF